MDLDFSEEQQLLRRTAREFMKRHFPKTVVRELEEDPTGFRADIWKQVADLGWIGWIIPQEYGGVGGNVLDLVVLCEEMGRAIFYAPFVSTVVAASVILDIGSEEQKRELLPRISKGGIIISLALTDEGSIYEQTGINLKAVENSGKYVLNGTSIFVRDAKVADYFLCAARTASEPSSKDGVTLFLVDAKSPGISVTPLATMAGDKQSEIIFENVPTDNIVGEPGKGFKAVQKAIELAAVAKSAEMIGGCDEVLDITSEYAKTRVQFDRPIGSFQAIQHYLADLSTEIAGAKTLMYKAAWTLNEGLPAAKIVAMAKAFAGDTYRHATAVGQQIFGGIGYIVDSDIQLYFRRAKTAQLLTGTSEQWEEVVAQELGL